MSNLINNTIYLRRKNKLYLEKENNKLDNIYIASFLKNIENLGYTFSPEILDIISTLSIETLTSFYNQTINDLKLMVGAHVEFKPMYPNFPQQVMNASQSELYFNAMMHYLGDWIGTRIMPEYTKNKREDLKDKIKLKTIGLGNINDFEKIFIMLLNSKTSISSTDNKDLEYFVISYGDNIVRLIPEQIPLKENIALLGAYLIKYTKSGEHILLKYLKTATDILRLITAMSEGDISLAVNTRFTSFSKKQRRLILSFLEDCNAITEDMLRYKEKWKRVGDKLHPFEYKNKFPKTFEAFDIIRNDKTFETFNRKVEQSLISKDTESVTKILKSRPGDFARRLDNLLRLNKNPELVLETFNNIADKVSSPVLLQVLTHFKNRNQNHELRAFFPKGEVGKLKAIKNDLPEISLEICNQVVSICETILIEKYSNLKPLGKVYLDEELKNFTVPFALRSASKALKTVSRGSKLDIPQGDTVRFFIWWKDGKYRTDLDLSAVALDSNHKYITDIAYYNLKSLNSYHSGDITSAPEGASEFIDINIPDFLKSDIRYVVMCVNSFTAQPFCDLPECFAGFMIRQNPNSGEIYEPKTIENKFDLTSDTKISIPLIIDLIAQKVFWTDIALKRHPSHSNNVYNNMSSITLMAKAMTSLVKPNLYDLFELHTKARGTIVANIEEADTIFSKNSGIKPTDIELIISDFL